MLSANGSTVLELCSQIHEAVKNAGIVLNENDEFIDEIGRYSPASFIVGEDRVVLTIRSTVVPGDFPKRETLDASLASRNITPKDGLFKLDSHGNNAKIVCVYELGEAWEDNPHITDAVRVDMDVFAIEIGEDDIDEIAAWAAETSKAKVLKDDEVLEALKGYRHKETTETKGACLLEWLGGKAAD
jgi:hypothetical protein